MCCAALIATPTRQSPPLKSLHKNFQGKEQDQGQKRR